MRMSLTSLLGCTCTLTACSAPNIEGKGENRRIEYHLSNDTWMEEVPLDEVGIIAWHEQEFSADLTLRGKILAHEEDRFEHQLQGAEPGWFEEEEDQNGLPGLSLGDHEPGSYELQTWRDGELFDRISLRFEEIAYLDAEIRLRPPGGDSYSALEPGAETVQVGTVATLVPAPIGADGELLAGSADYRLSAAPASRVDVNWLFDENLEFIEPGEVTLYLTDDCGVASFQRSFTVVHGE